MAYEIYKYTSNIQESIACPIVPEPWLHIIIAPGDLSNTSIIYAVYVWDTRQVVYAKRCMHTIKTSFDDSQVDDLKTKLQGNSNIIRQINKLLMP